MQAFFIKKSFFCVLYLKMPHCIASEIEKPESLKGDANETGLSRYKYAIKYGWVAFLPPFIYGFLESSLNALFPVYALRKDFDLAFVFGLVESYISQSPHPLIFVQRRG